MRPSMAYPSRRKSFPFYKILTPRDLDAVVTYVRSVPPVRNEVQPSVYKASMHVELVPGAEKPFEETALRDPVVRGFYLATTAHCMECHARRPDGAYDFTNWLGKGGHEMRGPYGTVTVRNITSHPKSGIGMDRCGDQAGAYSRNIARWTRF